jgi:hypothetical protein
MDFQAESFENKQQFKYKIDYRIERLTSDIVVDDSASPLRYDADENRLLVEYAIDGAPLREPAKMVLDWVGKDGNVIGQAYSWGSETGTGSHKLSIKPSDLGTVPRGAVKLRLQADPDDVVFELKEDNNKTEMVVPLDYAATYLTASRLSAGDVVFRYKFESISGFDSTDPVQVGLFWADGAKRLGGPIRSYELKGDNPFPPEEKINASSLGSRPAGATNLILLVDYDDAIAELNEGNNQKLLQVVKDPTVALRPDSGDVKKGDPYTILVDVTNNSLVPDSFQITLTETYKVEDVPRVDSAFPDPTVVRRTTPAIGPGQNYLLKIDFTGKYWHWLPTENPVTHVSGGLAEAYNTLLTFVAGAFKSLIEANKVTEFVVDQLADFLSLDPFNPLAPEPFKHNRPVPTVSFDEDAVVRRPGEPDRTVANPSAPLRVSVPEKFKHLLADHSTALNRARGLLFPIVAEVIAGPESYPLFVATWGELVANLALAREFYTQAVDPADPNFTRLASPTRVILSPTAGIPEGPLKQYVELTLEILALRHAEGLSRDRALGAQAAGELGWESTQLYRASDFANRAAILEVRKLGLAANLGLYRNPNAPAGSVREYLSTRGFPPVVADGLQKLGWSSAEIAGLLNGMLLTGVEPIPSETRREMDVVSALSLQATALDELREAVALRVHGLGQVSRPLTAEERARLDALRADALAPPIYGLPTQQTYDAIVAYLSQARLTGLAANNVDAVYEDLDLGYAALAKLAAYEPTPSGIEGALDTLVQSGRATPYDAAALAATLDRIESHLADQGFEAALSSVAVFRTQVLALRGTGLTAGDADRLMGAADYLAHLLSDVSPRALDFSVNGGQTQRSLVGSLSLRFTAASNLQDLIDSGEVADVVTVVDSSTGVSAGLSPRHFRWDATTNTLLVDLTVDGFGGSTRRLLGDGSYRLQIRTAALMNPDGMDALFRDDDGNNDGLLAYGFHQLFGDTDGDGDVDNADAFAFKSAMNKRLGEDGYQAFLDLDGNGVIDAFDFAEMKKRYGKKLNT